MHLLTLDSWEAFRFTDTPVSPSPSAEQESGSWGWKWNGHSVFQILNNDLEHEDVTGLHVSVDPEIKQAPAQPLDLPVRNPNCVLSAEHHRVGHRLRTREEAQVTAEMLPGDMGRQGAGSWWMNEEVPTDQAGSLCQGISDLSWNVDPGETAACPLLAHF